MSVAVYDGASFVGSFDTIQEAIDAASAGYTVVVDAGDYSLSSPIVIDKTLTIQGANDGIAGNAARGDESILTATTTAPLFQVTAAAGSVVIEGFKVIGDTMFGGIVPDQSITFSNNVFDVTATQDNVFFGGYQAGYAFNFTDNKVDVTGYTEFFDLFQGATINISGNSFAGHAGTYQSGDDNVVPVIVNASAATGGITDNMFSGVDIGVLVAGQTGPLEIAGNSFSDLHRVAGSTGGGLAAGIVFFAPDYAGEIDIHDNSFSDADAGIRTSGVPGTALSNEPVTVDQNSFTAVDAPVLLTIPGQLAATNSTIEGVEVPSALYGGSDDNMIAQTPAADLIVAGGGTDTVTYAEGATIDESANGWTVTQGGVTDTLHGVEKVVIGDQTFVLADHFGTTDGGFQTIQAAIDDSSDGDTILVAAGTYAENLAVNKAVTLVGANAGVGGADSRGAETIIKGETVVTASSTIDGVEIYNTSNDSTQFEGVRVKGAIDVSVTNSLFYSPVVNASNNAGGGVGDKAIYLDTSASGHVTFSNNLVTGPLTNGFSGANWSRGVWSDGATSQLDVTGNTFNYVRTGVNLDSYDDARINVSANHFTGVGTGLAVGTPVTTAITGIHDNVFTDVGEEFNLQNTGVGQSLDLTATNNVANGTFPASVEVVLGTQGDDSFVGSASSDQLKGNGGVDTVTYGAGAEIVRTATGWTVVQDGVTDYLSGVEKVVIGSGTFLLADHFGAANGGYQTIQAALNGATDGATVLVAQGTYGEAITLSTANVTLQGDGDVIVKGGFLAANGFASIYAGLPDAAGYHASALGSTGVTVSADGVTIDGVRIDDWQIGLDFTGNRADVTLSDVDLSAFVIGINKDVAEGLSGLTITGGTFSDGYNGINFAKTTTAGQAAIGTVTGANFAGLTFTNLLNKGIYLEAFSDSSIDDVTMTNVGQYGRARSFGGGNDAANGAGKDGNGINLNLKNGVYANVTIENFTLTNVGDSSHGGAIASGNTGGAIVIAARNDGGTYGPAPATVSNILVQNGTIDGNLSTGIRVGEAGQNNDGPGVTVSNVNINGAEHSQLHGDIANETTGTLTVTGTAAGDTLIASGNSDGAFDVSGTDGSDTLVGGSAADALRGGGDNDDFTGRSGNDTLSGGSGIDTAHYSGNAAAATIIVTTGPAGLVTGFTGVTTATDGTDALVGVEKLAFADRTLDVGDPVQLFDGNDHLVATFGTIQAAINAASTGFTVRAAAGEYAEDLTIDKAITLEGANAGKSGVEATRDAETVIKGASTISAAAVINGVEVLNSSNNSTQFIGIRITGSADVTVKNSLFYSSGVNGNAEDRAVSIDTSATGHITLAGNLVTGVATGKYGASASWHRGVWSDGTASALDITGNTFQYVRSSLNLDGYDDTKVTVANNQFVSNGTAISIATVAGNTITGIHDNVFTSVDEDVNLRNVATAQSFDLTATNNVGGGAGADALLFIKGGAGGDTLSGSAGADLLDARASLDTPPLTDNATNALDGRGGNDTLIGSNGDDRLTGGTGDDALNGGVGSDTAVFVGNRADYSFANTAGGVTVTDSVGGRDGVDTLNNVELVQFADRAQTLGSLVNNVAPTDIALDNQSVNENAANGTAVGTATATDPNSAGGDTVTYSLTDTAGGRFAIDAVTGAITVADGSLLNAEAAQSHGITVTATDSGGLFYSEVFTIAVGDVDEFDVSTPVDANAAANTVAENAAAGTLVGITAQASDADATTNAITYSLADSASGQFAINAATGVVTVAGAIDYEAGASRSITVKASSADGSIATQNFTVAITNVNEAPVIGSNGGGATASVSVPEDSSAVTTVTATDPDAATTITYSISGGDDASKFKIDATTGALAFKAAPNFESPTDQGGNNVYDVFVSASDGTLADTQAIAVSVTDEHETQTLVLTKNNDTFTANSDDNYVIDGLQGNDVITTRGGRDVVRGSAGNDTISTGANDDVITYIGNNNGGDIVDGGAGNDSINALAAGTIIGLSSVINVEKISANGYANVSIAGASTNDTLDFTSVVLENITLIDGANGNDIIKGGAGADVIDGGKNDDQLFGNGGDDTFLIGVSSGVDKIDGGSGSDTIRATADNVTLGWGGVTAVEAISASGFANFRILGTSAGDVIDLTGITVTGVVSIDGGNGNDVITGSAGNDTIIGGAGNDSLSGGAGNDLFLFANNTGADTIDGGADIDTLRATSNNAILTWGSFSNIEVIDGGGFTGATIAGTLGADVIDLSGITVTGIAAVDGGAGNDVITGTGGADTIIGNLGDDVLNGGGGNDSFIFTTGAGIDTIDGGSGTDTLKAGATGAELTWGNFTSVEAISSNGFAGVKIVGGNSNDVIDLTGYTITGITAIDGGKGNDTIIGTSNSDTIIGNSGDDTLSGGGGSDIFLFGAGNQGNDTIDGGDGTDTLRASAANVQFTLGNYTSIERIDGAGFSNVRILGTTGNDTLDLSAYTLSGISNIDAGKGNDTIIGSAGADTIIGGQGSDNITGGGGNDLFVYKNVNESATGAFDVIADFVHGDRFDLSGIDASTATAGDQAFAFIGTAAFTGTAGQLRYDQDLNGVTRISADINGDRVIDFQVRLADADNSLTLSVSDFLL